MSRRGAGPEEALAICVSGLLGVPEATHPLAAAPGHAKGSSLQLLFALVLEAPAAGRGKGEECSLAPTAGLDPPPRPGSSYLSIHACFSAGSTRGAARGSIAARSAGVRVVALAGQEDAAMPAPTSSGAASLSSGERCCILAGDALCPPSCTARGCEYRTGRTSAWSKCWLQHPPASQRGSP